MSWKRHINCISLGNVKSRFKETHILARVTRTKNVAAPSWLWPLFCVLRNTAILSPAQYNETCWFQSRVLWMTVMYLPSSRGFPRQPQYECLICYLILFTKQLGSVDKCHSQDCVLPSPTKARSPFICTNLIDSDQYLTNRRLTLGTQ